MKNLQESSWELEILISSGAIYTLIQASDFLNQLVLSLKITHTLVGTDLFLILGVFGIQVLTLGFILHLLLRAFWVAMVCANVVYPQGINPARIAWRLPFKVTTKNGADLYWIIERVNRFSSLVMFLSVISSFLVLGIIAVCFILISIPGLLGLNEVAGFKIYFSSFIILLSVYLLDLLSFGLLRRLPGLSYILYLPFRLFDILSLRVLYQQALWLYNTNVNRKRLIPGMLLFLLIAFFYSYASVYRTLHWTNIFDQRKYRWQMAPGPELSTNVYRDEANGDKVQSAQIPSKLISQEYLEVFLVYRKQYDNAMEKLGKHDKYLSDLAVVSINDSIYHNLTWHPNWNRQNDQLGITTMVPIKHLAPGPYELKLTSLVDSNYVLILPFWKVSE